MGIEDTDLRWPLTPIIDLPDEQTPVLEANARAQGVSTDQYARKVPADDLIPGWLQEPWASAEEPGLDGLSMDEIDAEIAATRKARLTGSRPRA